MQFNAHKKHLLFEKRNLFNEIKLSEVHPVDVEKDIEKIHNNKEKVYIFNSGDKAEFLYERSCVNDLSFNYFQIYNKSVFFAFKEIVNLLKNFCKEKNISVEKNLFYITSEYEKEFLEDYWYDSGGIGAPNFCGYWILKENGNAKIKVNSKEVEVVTGSIVLFESGAKTEFVGIETGISFNITTLSKLQSQYPQKWMPITML